MAANDAITLLKADHNEVAGMFEKFESARSTKAKLAQQICMRLPSMLRSRKKSSILPRGKRLVMKDLLNEANVEHNSLSEIEGSDPGDELFDAHVKVLGDT